MHESVVIWHDAALFLDKWKRWRYNYRGNQRKECGRMNYREELHDAKEYKQRYYLGLKNLILKRKELGVQRRSAYHKDIFSRQESYREEFKKLLGWPLVGRDNTSVPTLVEKKKLSDEEGYSVYRMTFDVLDGLEMTGLYFERAGEGKRPLVLTQHGGQGTPEAISGVYEQTGNYNDMLQRVIVHDVHAFAPQLLLWHREMYELPFDRFALDAQLKRLGSSIAAVELYALRQILNYFEGQDNVSNFGMVGLSYGGFYTLFLTAIDTRIKSAISCSFYNTRDKYDWNDWTWFGSADTFDDPEVACLVYPRKLCLEIGTKDHLFDVKSGEASFEKLKEMCQEVGTDWLNLIVFEGTHEFCKDDEPIKNLIEHLRAEE
jgi:dienelactone hydrolase